MKYDLHNREIVDQFSRQASRYTEKLVRSQEASLPIMAEMSGVSSSDEVLDVACGPGLVTCFFAAHSRYAEGIDLTPTMIEKARQIQAEAGLRNVSWKVGTVLPLPYPDASFSIVVTRYSFHHFLAPLAVLKDMVRVCRPGGTVMIVDVSVPADKRDRFNYIEKLRDSSHVSIQTPDELLDMANAAGLKDIRTKWYDLELELEKQIDSSFPAPGDEYKIRSTLRADLGKDNTGMRPHEVDGNILIVYPTLIVAGRTGN